MLHRIVIINTEAYAKADLLLGDVESLQLVGENNIGKSSLINTLNFLYIVDQRQMRFEGDRLLKDSLHHYFPTLDRSYMLFELENSKQGGSYCILVRRNKNNELAYYQVHHAYEGEWCFAPTREGGQEVVPFEALLATLAERNIACKPLSSRERYLLLYRDRAETSPAVALTAAAQEGARGGNANHFTRLYKYLLRGSRIAADDLLEALIIALEPAKTALEIFAHRQRDSLERLTKTGKKIEALQRVEPLVADLMVHYHAYQAQEAWLGKALYTFQEHYPKAVEEQRQHLASLAATEKKVDKEHTIQEAAMVAAHQAIGGTKVTIETHERAVATHTDTLAQAKPYLAPLAFQGLRQEVARLQEELTALEGLAHRPQKALQEEVKALEVAEGRLKQQLQEYGNLLLHHLTPDPVQQQRLQQLLSHDLLHLHKRTLKRPITTMGEEMMLFDGLLDISALPALPAHVGAPTKQSLEEKLARTTRQLAATRKALLGKEAYGAAEQALTARHALLRIVEDAPATEALLAEATKALAKAKKALQRHEQVLAKATEALGVVQARRATLQQAQQEVQARVQTYDTWRQALAKVEGGLSLVATLLVGEEELARLYPAIEEALEARTEAYQHYRKPLQEVRQALMRYDMDDAAFLEDLTKEYANLEGLVASWEEMVEAIRNQFVQPTATFLASYRHFKEAIAHFSQELAAVHISGLHDVGIHLHEHVGTLEELQAIATLPAKGMLALGNDETSALAVLHRYIAQERRFHLRDLFTLQVRIVPQEGARPLFLSPAKQMQSYGTDKMLRLFIFLQLLQRYLPADTANRIVIYVDEIGTLSTTNIAKLQRYCQRCHVLPIFAATTHVEGFQRYYQLFRSADNGGKVWVDSTLALDYTPLPTEAQEREA